MGIKFHGTLAVERFNQLERVAPSGKRIVFIREAIHDRLDAVADFGASVVVDFNELRACVKSNKNGRRAHGQKALV